MTEENKRFLLDDVDELVRIILEEKQDISAVRLHKSVYLLYSYYGMTYGQLSKELVDERSEIEYNYPKRLVDVSFEAWKYGPVSPKVQKRLKRGDYFPLGIIDRHSFLTSEEKDVLDFLKDLIKQINDMSDYGLIDRVRQDEVWRKVYKRTEDKTMDNSEIINYYLKEYQ